MFFRIRIRFVLLALVAVAFFWFIARGHWDYKEVEDVSHRLRTGMHDITNRLKNEMQSFKDNHLPPKIVDPLAAESFKAGVPQPAGHEYTISVVMGSKKGNDVSWLDQEVERPVKKAVYVVDDPSAKLRLPLNKGNEAMVYLTYIIDHYHKLSDVTLFMHHHRWTWHNNDILDNDSVKVIEHILPQRVIREGYVNLRCQWTPGCPKWLNPATSSVDPEKEEEVLVKLVWSELFPDAELPNGLAQPCCSQFALSRERIRAIPRSEYQRLRQWLISTDISDKLSGRLFEYLWQYLWTGAPVLCPSQSVCYCDLYGICFEDEEAFQRWFEVRHQIQMAENAIMNWELGEDKRKEHMMSGEMKEAEAQQASMDSAQWYDTTREILNSRWIVLGDDRAAAIARGRDGKVRAKIVGREPDAGD